MRACLRQIIEQVAQRPISEFTLGTPPNKKLSAPESDRQRHLARDVLVIEG